MSGTGHAVQLDWRGTPCRRAGGCAIPHSQGFPDLGRALATRPVSSQTPMPRPLGLVLAVGDAGPGMGCVPLGVSAVCNQPCVSPAAARLPLIPISSHPTARGSLGPSAEPLPCTAKPSLWSISKQQRRERRTREHTAVRRVFYSCASSSSLGQDSGPPGQGHGPWAHRGDS